MRLGGVGVWRRSAPGELAGWSARTTLRLGLMLWLGVLLLAPALGAADRPPNVASAAGSNPGRSAAGASVFQAAGQPGLVAAYGFDEGSGTTAGDASGNGNAGALSNTASITQGRFGKALSFNGANSWVTVTSAALDLRGSLTLEAWVYPTTASGWRSVLLKEHPAGLAYGLYSASGGSGPPRGYVQVGGERGVAGAAALPANAWTHLATTYDGAQLRLYVNGVQVGSQPVSGAVAGSAQPLRIGGNALWGDYFAGRIDEVRIYGRALSQAEIQADMATPTAPGGPPPACFPSGTVAKIMPLGDSITASRTPLASYRYYLWRQLQDGGQTNVDFVGGQSGVAEGPPLFPDFDQDHEGHSGWRADEVAAAIGVWAAIHQPDIVLVHLGTNDLGQGQDVPSTLDDLRQIVLRLREQRPGVIVLLAQLIPRAGPAGDGIEPLNAQIPALVAELNTPQSPVVRVDQWTGFDEAADLYDGTHPNDAGEQKLAAQWRLGLLPFFCQPAGPTATPTPTPTAGATTPTPTATTTPTPTATTTPTPTATTTPTPTATTTPTPTATTTPTPTATTTPTPTATTTPTPTATTTPTPTATTTPTPIATVWYFAEGYTADGFDEYLTVQNPHPVPAELTITYLLNAGAPIEKKIVAPANSRYTVAVHDSKEGVGRGKEVSAKVVSANGVGIVVERPMYFTYSHGVTGGHNVMGVQAPRRSWLFGEGYTGTGFDEYLTIANPNAAPAPVTITYYLGGGQAPVEKRLIVPANARYTVVVHDPKEGVGRGQEVSARVETTLAEGIVVERPIYFRYGGIRGGVTGGHNVMGAAGPRAKWYFPEGNTNADWDEYLTLMNTFARASHVRLTYYVVGEPTPRTKVIVVPANSRYTVTVHDGREGVGRGARHGTKVETLNGVNLVVERPLYFRYSPSVNGGHNVMGAAAPARMWLFAEGYTGVGFDECLIALNPNSQAADVSITYYLNGGYPIVRTLKVDGYSRALVSVHDSGQVGRGQEVSAKVEVINGVDVVVERPIYFAYLGRIDGGHTVMGYTP